MRPRTISSHTERDEELLLRAIVSSDLPHALREQVRAYSYERVSFILGTVIPADRLVMVVLRDVLADRRPCSELVGALVAARAAFEVSR